MYTVLIFTLSLSFKKLGKECFTPCNIIGDFWVSPCKIFVLVFVLVKFLIGNSKTKISGKKILKMAY